MTAVPVEIAPRRPLPDDLPTHGSLSYATRLVEEPAPAVTTITPVADLDTVMDALKCSCNAGDDNPH
ncbi:hypothetical protein JJV70_13325 [Streptomyces sp. JJ66]|uniref:hypothetical protein n=1 Tax=Streptomyces sp. JJ66 TaxID=2803843 RepID=UPI001C591CA2|nr:hypothetical protein [Streptomyces sp. JJ66]MBW1603070.1 hypothetical protein [Streptomyces sp. JJ66]